MATERVCRGFLEKDVESADEYEHFSEDIFDPTEPDNDVVEDPNGYDDIEIDNNDVAVRMMMQLMISPFLSLIPMILGLLNLIPTPMKVPRETKLPETMLPIRQWSPTQTKIRVPISAISGPAEADPTATNLSTKWMTP